MHNSDHLDEHLFQVLYCKYIQFSTHGSCLYNNILIQSMKFSPNPNFFKTDIKKLWSSESKAFSISFATRWLFIFKLFVTLRISEINLPLSPMNRFSN